MDYLARAKVAVEAVIGGSRACDLETETLEFKTDGRSAKDTVRDIAEATACFANSRGGVVIVGVKDSEPGPGAVVGSDLDPQRTQRGIFELTKPNLPTACEGLTVNGRTLLVVGVTASPDVHAVGGRATERIGDSCQEMDPQRIATVITDRRGDDWSGRDSGVALSEVSAAALEALRSTLTEAHGGGVEKYSTDGSLVTALGLVTLGGTLSNAGALLLTGLVGRREEFVYTFRRTPTGSLITNEHLQAPVVLALRRIFDLIGIRTDRTSVNLRHGQQLQIPDLPDDAVRESIINAVMHRDYRSGEPIRIEHTPERMAVTSPGPFVSGVSPTNILTVSSRTRNAALAYALRTAGLAESAGTGIDRMYVAMGRVGHRPPTFEADTHHVTVTLRGGSPNAYVTRYVSTLPHDVANDADTMLVLLALLTKRTITADELAPLSQQEPDDAQRVLAHLASESVQMLEATRRSVRWRRPVYRFREHVIADLRPTLSYQRRTTDTYDRTLIGVVRETGGINARLVKLTLAVDGPTASRILADLVRRAILVRTSEATRGPSVAYGPGPKFPTKKRAKSAADGTV